MTVLEIHVDPRGPAQATDGQVVRVRTLDAAFAFARDRRRLYDSTAMWLHHGTHHLAEPLTLGPDDSHTTITAWEGASPVIDGGQVVTGWVAGSLRGRTVWTAPAPANCGRALYVGGERVQRPRWPKQGSLRMPPQPDVDLKADAFETLFNGAWEATVDPGELPPIETLDGLELVVPHFWVQERMPVTDIDFHTGRVSSSRRSIFVMRDGMEPAPPRWWLDGVADHVGDEPGLWVLDTDGAFPLHGEQIPSGPRLVYSPTQDDRLANFEAVVPVVDSLVMIAGAPDNPVVNVQFSGITFRHAEGPEPAPARIPFGIREDPDLPDVTFASHIQAACGVPGAIEMTHVRQCSIVNSLLERVGGFGVRFGEGAQGCRVTGTVIRDTGAGSVACGGSPEGASTGATSDIEISDCILTHGGRTYPQAAAVLIQHASEVRVVHCDINNHPSTGIALGWSWDYGPSAAVDNLVEGNHMHHLGGQEVDWFGAIYTLGVSPGTRIRRNHIHDVKARHFGGWGLLIDPASSELVVEENVIHDVSAECVHIKSGRDNTFRRNVLAHGAAGLISLAVTEPHLTASFLFNTFVPGEAPIVSGAPGSLSAADVAQSGALVFETNTVLHSGGEPVWAADVEQQASQWRVVTDHSHVWHNSGGSSSTVMGDREVTVQQDGSLDVATSDINQRDVWTGADLKVGPRSIPQRSLDPSLNNSRS